MPSTVRFKEGTNSVSFGKLVHSQLCAGLRLTGRQNTDLAMTTDHIGQSGNRLANLLVNEINSEIYLVIQGTYKIYVPYIFCCTLRADYIEGSKAPSLLGVVHDMYH